MSNRKKTLALWLAGLATTALLAACGSSDTEPTTPVDTPVQSEPADPQQPGEPTEPGEEVTGESFEGEVSTETITANLMEMEIPTGLRIPENALVTNAEPSAIMIADEDEGPIVDMVLSSAAEAGYETVAEVQGQWVLVGHGNAVLFTAFPNAQLITWGPESMKDVLAESLNP